jgi:Zn-dependent protease with chaperone function
MENGSTAGSLMLIALGAILAWAVDYRIAGIDIRVVGAIFLVVGVIGLLLSLLFWASFAPFRRSRERIVVQTEEAPRP